MTTALTTLPVGAGSSSALMSRRISSKMARSAPGLMENLPMQCWRPSVAL
ncbi:hypothetical protein [Nocardia asteroides]